MNDNLSAAKILCLSEPAWKTPLGFTYSICFRTHCWKLLSSEDHNKGQQVDDGHFGIIRIPCPLHNAKWEIVLQISLTGGTIQQLWPDQLKPNASTPPYPGHQYGEKNKFVLWLFVSGKRSQVNGPHNLLKKSKNF